MTDWPRPFVTADVAAFTITDGALKILLIERGHPPCEGMWALPGGFVDVEGGETGQGEDLADAALRELAEETGVAGEEVTLQQFGAFGRPGRDTRGRVITIAYFALVPPDVAERVQAGDDAARAEWRDVATLDLSELAFDHEEIVGAALGAVRRALDDTAVARSLVVEPFTVAELREVYELLRGELPGGERIDPANFNRRFRRLVDAGLVQTLNTVRKTSARPAQEYRFVRA